MRLIDEEGKQVGILNIDEALRQAQRAGLDLVEISPQAEPPVCRLLDYGKYTFELSKKQGVQRKKQRQIQVKEIKFRPATDIGDYKVKLKKIVEFLEEGDKVKVTLRFRGREVQHKDLGMDLLQRLVADVGAAAHVESEPKMEGKQITLVFAPAK